MKKRDSGGRYPESIYVKVSRLASGRSAEPVKLSRGEMRTLGHVTQEGGQRSIYAAVRGMCVDCMGGAGPQDAKGEIERCTSVGCPLWPFRFGKRIETVSARLIENPS
jgi:hypothetical protein